MLSRRVAFVPVVLAGALLLAGCSPSGPNEPLNPDDVVLADDLDLDSYHVEGTIDGIDWSGDLCAFNLIPSFGVLYKGEDSPYYTLYFEANDKEITDGVVKGIWRLNDDINYTVQVNKGTWSSVVPDNAQDPGTISVQLQVTERPPAGGAIDRTVNGTLNLTPVTTSDECIAMNEINYLRESLETYGGPTGDGV